MLKEYNFGNYNSKNAVKMEKILPRCFVMPKSSFFLFGPRGTGKSTWARYNISDSININLLEPGAYRSYLAHPERLRDVIMAKRSKKVVFIDEIQKVPDLLDQIHSIIEDQKRVKFVVTGSSTRKLKKSSVNFLGGRLSFKLLHPFIACELGKQFDFKRSLRVGLIPLIWQSNDPEDTLDSYISLYLKEEIESEGFVRNIANFARFLEAVSFSHASILNISNIARECEVERKTVEGYLSILDNLFFSFNLPCFIRRAKRKTIKRPKFYLFDTGVFRTLRPTGPLDQPSEIEGCALEGLVAQHLRAWNDYSGSKHKIYYWRTRSGLEVDFIIYSANSFVAIEVKNSTKIRPRDLQGLKAFRDDYPECRQLLLYRGKERIMINGILCMPCLEFIKSLIPGKEIISE